MYLQCQANISYRLNNKIQATYYHQEIPRTREEFLLALKNNSRSIVL